MPSQLLKLLFEVFNNQYGVVPQGCNVAPHFKQCLEFHLYRIENSPNMELVDDALLFLIRIGLNRLSGMPHFLLLILYVKVVVPIYPCL